MAEFASNTTPMKSSKGDALDHPVTDLEAARSILVQGLPLLDQELTESSIVQVFSAYGEITKLLLQTNEESKSQRAVLVFREAEGARAALQANGRDILGANCTVGLASSMPTLDEGLGRENVSDQAAGGDSDGAPLTTAEWIKSIFAQGMVYTRLFDEKLGVSKTARDLAARAQAGAQKIDETHNISGKMAAVAMTVQAKTREVDTKYGVSEVASKWATKTKESTDRALETHPRVAAGVQQAGGALNKLVSDVSGYAQQALGSQVPEEQAEPRRANHSGATSPTRDDAAASADAGYPAVVPPRRT